MCIFSHKKGLEQSPVTGYCFMGNARDTVSPCQSHFIYVGSSVAPQNLYPGIMNKYYS